MLVINNKILKIIKRMKKLEKYMKNIYAMKNPSKYLLLLNLFFWKVAKETLRE